MGKNYLSWSSKKVAVSVGTFPVLGKGKTQFVSASFSADLAGVDVGVDGDYQFYDIEDASGEITLTLMRYSPTNAVLTAMAAGKFALPIFIKNNAGTADVFATGAARVKKWPDWVGAQAPGEVTWVFTYGNGRVAFSEAKEQGLIPFNVPGLT